jgi:beta-lactamase class A
LTDNTASRGAPHRRIRTRRRRSARRRALFLQLSAFVVAGAVLATLTTVALQFARHRPAAASTAARPVAAPSPIPIVVPSPSPSPAPSPAPNNTALNNSLNALIAASGARVGIEVVDLGATPSIRIQINAGDTFDAASTYKLPLLMANAEAIAKGRAKPSDKICFSTSEQEDGWFDDYNDGDCFTRQTLGVRVGTYSDNTAAHMLVDNLGGTSVLEAYANSHGAKASAFYVPNDTTAADLATLLVVEATGGAGGQPAQNWLYPLLTNTAYEKGLPAGVPDGVTVVHKVGAIDGTIDDVGIVMAPKAPYVISVMSDGPGGDAGYALVAQISAAVWAAESS